MNTRYGANSQILANDPAVDRFHSRGIFDNLYSGLLKNWSNCREVIRSYSSLRSQDVPGKHDYCRQAENHHP